MQNLDFEILGRSGLVARRSVRGALKLEIDKIDFLSSTPGPRNGGGGLNRSAQSARPKERIAGTVARLRSCLLAYGYNLHPSWKRGGRAQAAAPCDCSLKDW